MNSVTKKKKCSVPLPHAEDMQASSWISTGYRERERERENNVMNLGLPLILREPKVGVYMWGMIHLYSSNQQGCEMEYL